MAMILVVCLGDTKTHKRGKYDMSIVTNVVHIHFMYTKSESA